MKTLIVETDALRARNWAMHFGSACDVCDIARSTGQARLMLIAGNYDRLCVRLGAQSGASYALLSVARATNPNCEIVDLSSQSVRLATGPITERDVATAEFR